MSIETRSADHIYLRMKSEILIGKLRPGSIVVERLLAMEYGVSVSPIRDAAQRLLGERLLERGEVRGYGVPPFSTARLANLYNWHGQLVRLAIRHRSRDLVPTLLDLSDLAEPIAAGLSYWTSELFGRLGDAVANQEYGSAIRSAGDRLHLTRLCEPIILTGIEQELATIAGHAAAGRTSDLVKAIQSYDRRRMKRVDAIARVVRSGGPDV